MKATARVYLSPVAALVTIAIGVWFVRAAETVASLFEPTPVVTRGMEENIGVTSTENFKSFMPERTTQGRVLACYDPSILPIWHELKQDAVFKETLGDSSGVMNCSDMIEIRGRDLNGDSKHELLVRGKGPHLCTDYRNCGFWVFEERDSRYRKLLASTDHVEVVGLDDPTQRSRTRGYLNLLLREQSSTNETSYRTYAFDGDQYAETRCVFERPKYFREGEGSWELVACE